MTGYSKRWVAWRAAEAAIDKVGIDEAAATLPPRLGWLLRATHALWIGDHGASGALQLDVDAPPFARMILLDSVLEAGAVDPTRLRALVKNQGAQNKPLPFLDLIRLLAVAVSGERSASAAPALKKYARDGHIVLDAATMALHRSFTGYEVSDLLAARSPRLASAWAACMIRRSEDTPVRALVKEFNPDIEPLDEESWPDLDEYFIQDRGRPVRGASAKGLAQFLAAPLEQEWKDDFHDQLARGKFKPEEARDLLGGLIDAAHELILAGRWSAATPVLEGAIDMTRRYGHDEIRRWLSDAWTRNEVLNGPRDAAVLDSVWISSADLPAAERDQIALHLVRLDDRHGLRWENGDEAKVRALKVGYAGDRSDFHLAHLVLGLRTKLQRKAIAEIPKDRQPLVESGVQALKGNLPAAVTLAGRALLGETDVQVDREAALTAMDGANSVAQTSPDLPKHVVLDIVDRNRIILETALSKGVPVPASNLCSIVLLAVAVTDQITPALLQATMGHLETAQSAGFEGEIFTVYSRLQIVLSLCGNDAAQEQFKRYGRWLRTLPKPRATQSALCTAGSLGVLLSEAPPGGEDQRPKSQLLAWRQSLTAYVDQQGDTEAAKAAASLVGADHLSAEAIDLWLEECSSLEGTSEAWDDFARRFSSWSPVMEWQSADDLENGF